MNNDKTKKELKKQYKERKITGGVYMIRNTRNGKIYLDTSMDLQGSENRFVFSQKMNQSVLSKLQKDWIDFGSDAFAFEILEEIEKKENQDIDDFKSDIGVLKELWLEKLAGADLY